MKRSNQQLPTGHEPATPNEAAKGQHVVELLPFLLNGSLEPAAATAVREHLAACAACSREMELTAAAGTLYAHHPASLELVQYALGSSTAEPERRLIEEHLAHCPQCRSEVELVQSEDGAAEVVPFPVRPARSRPARSRLTQPQPAAWRRMALAASLLLALITGLALVLSRHEAPAPRLAQTKAASTTAELPALAEPPEVAASGVFFSSGFEGSVEEEWSVTVGLVVANPTAANSRATNSRSTKPSAGKSFAGGNDSSNHPNPGGRT